MKNKGLFTRVLAIAGTALVWIPVLATFIAGITASISRGKPTLDYLMPGELFLFALAGSVLLLWAAGWSHIFLKQIAVSFIALPVFLIACQTIAVTSGIASGARPAGGFAFAVMIAFFVLYVAALFYLCFMGIMFLRKLYRKES
jgi:hypothetical protein